MNFNIEQVADSPGKIVKASFIERKTATKRDKVGTFWRGISQGIPSSEFDFWPNHCLVEGYITPHIQFAMMLPADDAWNENFWLAACEGWCGEVNYGTLAPALSHGYAVITNNGGHYGSNETFDAVWAHQDLEARINFAHRANHVSADVGKAIIKEYFSNKPKYSYIAGFSKGGNAGLFAAQRYPDDFDGVISRAPVVNYNPKNAAHMPWIAKAVYPDGKNPVIYSDKIPLIHDAVTVACDELDGLKDGIIDDPRKCSFDPIVLLCKADQSEENNECLNETQVDAVRKIYQKPQTPTGKIYFDYPADYGSENEWRGVLLPVRDSNMNAAFYDGAVTGHYMAFKDNPGPGFDWMSFDYTKHTKAIAKMSKILDPDDPDLSAFKENGGKIIIFHGWSDGYISANMTIDYFDKMQAKMGGRTATADFAQLYILPGVDHALGGPAPHIVDAHSAIVDWVEKGIAPQKLIAKDSPGVEPFRTRPVFPYPARAKYNGEGDPHKDSSFYRVE